jgi:NADPH-dependent 2,4-dienoyl-CoA reductase/sulfur reductase-like enzyme
MDTDVVVLGAGPAGLAAACAALEAGVRVVVVEREERLGGILKQCVHDGFGLVRYGEKLSGPEYAHRDADRFAALGGSVLMEAFVSKAGRRPDGFLLDCIDRSGVVALRAKAMVLATGCRERTDRQVFVHGDRPAGIYTAGLAQYMMNIQGLLPGRRALILGSGDIGLIMARRMTLEGMEVLGAHEVKPEPSGLSRNVRQCLEDYAIPLALSSTVTAVHGSRRVTGVTTARVDASLRPIPGTELEVACDTLILSVGLIPENELAQSLGVPLDPATKGPRVDQYMHTLVDGVFACGNAVHVNDLADYVSESGETAGRAAAAFAERSKYSSSSSVPERRLVPVQAEPEFLYTVPQFVDIAGASAASGAESASSAGRPVVYFRVRSTISRGAKVRVAAGGIPLFERSYPVLRPPEMERFQLDGYALSEALAGIPAGALAGTSVPRDNGRLTVEMERLEQL